jgi:hypothetical protein
LGGTTLRIGDTLHVLFSAQNPPVSGTLVALTTDDGENYITLHAGASYESGDSVVLDYVLTQPILGGQASSANCIVRVSAYPTGFETYSAKFSIAAGSGASARSGHAATQRNAQRASVVLSSSGLQIRVRSAVGETGQRYSINGKVVRQIDELRRGQLNR